MIILTFQFNIFFVIIIAYQLFKYTTNASRFMALLHSFFLRFIHQKKFSQLNFFIYTVFSYFCQIIHSKLLLVQNFINFNDNKKYSSNIALSYKYLLIKQQYMLNEIKRFYSKAHKQIYSHKIMIIQIIMSRLCRLFLLDSLIAALKNIILMGNLYYSYLRFDIFSIGKSLQKHFRPIFGIPYNQQQQIQKVLYEINHIIHKQKNMTIWNFLQNKIKKQRNSKKMKIDCYYILLLQCIIIQVITTLPIDQLLSVQSGSLVVSANAGSPNLLNNVGGNYYNVVYANAFVSNPSVGVALSQFSTAVNLRYALQVTTNTSSTTAFNMSIIQFQNSWESLSVRWLSTIANSIILGIICIDNLGVSTTTIPTVSTQNVAPALANTDQNSVKFQIFISGFNLDTTTVINSQLTLSASINYNSNDVNNSLYNIVGDYIYPITSTGVFSGNDSNAKGAVHSHTVVNNVTSVVISGTTVTATTYVLIPSQFILNLIWLGNLKFLQLTYIVHPVSVSSTASIKFTTGYNTFSITSTSISNTVNIFDPLNTKNNLGSLNTQSFYGFTAISLTPISSIDASITLLYSYKTTLASSNSSINSLSASYFFYQPFASTINNIVSIELDNLISPLPTWTWTQPISLFSATASSYPYYMIQFSNSTPHGINLTYSFTTIASKYLLVIEILDQQGCWYNFGFISIFVVINPIGSNTSVAAITASIPHPFVNPDSGCTSTSSNQFSVPIQKYYLTYPYTFLGSGSNINLKIDFQSGVSGSQTNNIYVKLNMYKLSSTDIINPMITEASYSAVDYFYDFQTFNSSSYKFYSAYSIGTPSNAIQLSIRSDSQISFFPSKNINLTSGNMYAISFYILDSAGNINSDFSNPVINVYLNNNSIYSKTATLNQPFCSSLFSSISPLATPTNDNLYVLVKFSFIAPLATNNITFILRDMSTINHLYWIRGIGVYAILVYDPVSRTNVPSCPSNSYLATNTQPPACQICDLQGKIATVSGCVCQTPTNEDPITKLCKN